MHQNGVGVRFSITHRLPKNSRGQVRVANLNPGAKDRLGTVRYAHKRGVAAAMEAFNCGRAVSYRWLHRYNFEGSLNPGEPAASVQTYPHAVVECRAGGAAARHPLSPLRPRPLARDLQARQ